MFDHPTSLLLIGAQSVPYNDFLFARPQLYQIIAITAIRTANVVALPIL
jgi:hypothetical protein